MKAPKWFIEKIKQIDPALDIIKGRWGYWHLVKNIDTPGRKNYYKEDKTLWDIPKSVSYTHLTLPTKRIV